MPASGSLPAGSHGDSVFHFGIKKIEFLQWPALFMLDFIFYLLFSVARQMELIGSVGGYSAVFFVYVRSTAKLSGYPTFTSDMITRVLRLALVSHRFDLWFSNIIYSRRWIE